MLHRLAIALYVVAAPAQAATADRGLCLIIAERIRAGDLNHTDRVYESIVPDGFVQELRAPDEDVIGTLHRIHARPELMAAFGRFAMHESRDAPEIVRIGDSGAGAIVDRGGHMGCARFLFFDVRGGSARFLPPPVDTFLDKISRCAGSAPQLALVSQVPALVVHLSDLPISHSIKPNTESIRVIPWQRERWGTGCRLDAEFSAGDDRERGTIMSVSVAAP